MNTDSDNRLFVLDAAAIRSVASRVIARDAVRRAFIVLGDKEAEIFPVAIGSGAVDGSMMAAKSGRSREIVGLKIGTYWPGNADRGIPNHAATTLLLSPDTGMVSSVLNVSMLNGLRTAAADALAVDALARKDARVLAVIGTGHQAMYEVEAVLEVRTIERIRLWNRSRGRAESFANDLRQQTTLDVEVIDGSPDDAARPADIVITATNSQKPLLSPAGIRPGTHISAMGADRKGKQELAADILAMTHCRAFADYPEQSVEIGEFQHAAAAGLLTVNDVTPLGRVLSGAEAGRRRDEDITVFDSSGVAIQDIEVALAVVNAARMAGLGTSIRF